MPTRRSLLVAGLAPLAPGPAHAWLWRASQRPALKVFVDPFCGCCGGWITHMRRSGFAVARHVSSEMTAVKARHGVPDDLVSCHTALVDGYVIEGHVPARDVLALLERRPLLRGLAAPGMPVGSPGMETPGAPPEPFQVIGFAADGSRSVFADYPRGYAGPA